MLLNLGLLIKKYNIKITGVIHVGAHHGQEVVTYRALGIKDIVLVEPAKDAFHVLQNRYGAHHHIKLFNYALASYKGTANMYVETANNGQSNSLLAPALHREHYPDIKFTGTEEVLVTTLDSLNLSSKYNMINMDVQGAEAGVIIGGQETLKHIDYIYSEVNNQELYTNCTKIEQLDNLLSNFNRVETKWMNEGWGDALYIRKK